MNVNKLPITGEIKNLSTVLSSFLPTVMLVTVAAIMPALVGRSESLMRHWTRSTLNRAVMRKTLLLLLLMVLILPSLGLASAQAFFSWTVHARDDMTPWECVFLPDQVRDRSFLLIKIHIVNLYNIAQFTGCSFCKLRHNCGFTRIRIGIG